MSKRLASYCRPTTSFLWRTCRSQDLSVSERVKARDSTSYKGAHQTEILYVPPELCSSSVRPLYACVPLRHSASRHSLGNSAPATLTAGQIGSARPSPTLIVWSYTHRGLCATSLRLIPRTLQRSSTMSEKREVPLRSRPPRLPRDGASLATYGRCSSRSSPTMC